MLECPHNLPTHSLCVLTWLFFASLVSAALARNVKVLSAFLLEPVSFCMFAIGYPAAIASHAPIPGSMGLFLRIPRRVQAVPNMYSDLFKLFLSSYLFLTFKELRLQFLQKVQHTNHLIFRGLLFHSYFTNSLHC